MTLCLILRLFLAKYVSAVGVVGWGTRSRVLSNPTAKIQGTRSDILADDTYAYNNGISYEEISTGEGMHIYDHLNILFFCPQNISCNRFRQRLAKLDQVDARRG